MFAPTSVYSGTCVAGFSVMPTTWPIGVPATAPSDTLSAYVVRVKLGGSGTHANASVPDGSEPSAAHVVMLLPSGRVPAPHVQ